MIALLKKGYHLDHLDHLDIDSFEINIILYSIN